MKQGTSWRKISIGLLLAMLLLTGCKNSGETAQERAGTQISLSGMDADTYRVKEVLNLTDGGYAVTVQGSGFESAIEAKVYFDGTGDHITELEILSQEETEGLGSRITEPEFLAIFSDFSAPVTVTESDMQIVDPAVLAEIEKKKQEALTEGKDGTYESQAGEFSSGYKAVTALTIENGKITDVSYDAVNEEGVLKSDISKNGQYVMTEDGLLWHEQAEKIEEYVIKNQTVSISTDDAGKTDAIAGVSISVSEAFKLLQDCYSQANEAYADDADMALPVIEGTAFDAVTGATRTSEGVAKAINNAYFFLKNYIVE
ncbi:MAG: FMN-binding protein [Lachnospiraceae bacterium]|nr:FMN-binding protein [Lachnospiraceae bacterium]